MDKVQTQQYVSSQEGTKILGVDAGRFFYYVQSGQIAKKLGSGKRNARYSVSDILKVKEKLSTKQRSQKNVHSFVDWIGVDDVLTSLQLDYRVYGEEVFLADLPYYATRVVKNPHVALAVFDSPKRERILAYISLLPLPEATILEILRGERHETKILTEEIETYERKGGYTLLAESVAVDPERPEQLNTLLKHLTDYWCNQYPERYITKLYAQAESKHGDILIQKLFLAPREDLAPNAYVLNLSRPGASRFIQRFQDCLEEKRKALGLPETWEAEQPSFVASKSRKHKRKDISSNVKSDSQTHHRTSKYRANDSKVDSKADGNTSYRMNNNEQKTVAS